MKKNIYYLLLLLISLSPLAASAASVQSFIDVLAWRASESSSAWVTTISPLLNPNLTPATANNVTWNYLNFNTQAGLKAGILYAPEDNYIDTKFYWTYFPTGSSQNIPVGNHVLASLFFSGSAFLSGDVFFGAYAKWQLVMNMFDLEVSHHFKPTPSLTLTPKLGIKGGSINQSINIDWNAVLYHASENATNNFTGIGPSFGLNAKWNAWQNFNIVGDVSTAFMYGRWNEGNVYNRPAFTVLFLTTPPITNITSMSQSKLGTMMMDYYFGLEWVHQGRSKVSFNLGYEMQYWAGQLRWLAVQQFPVLGDLTIQGATCGITIDL